MHPLRQGSGRHPGRAAEASLGTLTGGRTNVTSPPSHFITTTSYYLCSIGPDAGAMLWKIESYPKAGRLS